MAGSPLPGADHFGGFEAALIDEARSIANLSWTVNPLHEFYIEENWLGKDPNFTKVATFTIDGEGTYDVMTNVQTNQPNITGTNATFVQFWSVRKTKRPVLDGTSGVQATCSVQGQGPFTFSGSLYGSTSDADEIIVAFSGGQVGPDKTTGTVSVTIVAPVHGVASTTVWGDCSVSVLGGQIKGGSIWAALSCPSLNVATEGTCSVDSSSVIVFDHCDGS